MSLDLVRDMATHRPAAVPPELRQSVAALTSASRALSGS